MNTDDRTWREDFQIQSEVELDFVIGQGHLPIGMTRTSPPEFRRRIHAASISYLLQLKSIDYTLKHYVDPGMYEGNDTTLGDTISDYLRDSAITLQEEQRKLHTEDPTFGVFGAEFTLFRIPHSLDTARMLSNRGLLLEVLPVLRLCLEMMCWANVALRMENEAEVVALKAQSCVSHLKDAYPTVGKLYGYLSGFTHWGHFIQGHFLNFEEEHVGVVKASVRYRAMALALCLVILDVLIEVIRQVYGDRSDPLVLKVQGGLSRDGTRKTYQYLSKITERSGLEDVRAIQLLLQ